MKCHVLSAIEEIPVRQHGAFGRARSASRIEDCRRIISVGFNFRHGSAGKLSS